MREWCGVISALGVAAGAVLLAPSAFGADSDDLAADAKSQPAESHVTATLTPT